MTARAGLSRATEPDGSVTPLGLHPSAASPSPPTAEAALQATLSLPLELVEAIARRTAELVGEAGPAASPWMTIDEAAQYLRWPKHSLYKLTGAGAIPHRKHGNRILFHRGELDDWLEDYREGPVSRNGAPARRTR